MILLKKSEGVTWSYIQLQAPEPLLKIVCENIYSCRLIPGKNCKQMYGKSKASDRRNLSTVTAPKICLLSKIPCCVTLVYKSYLFQNSRFTEIVRQFHV